jgi:transcriptional regulator with XRE-family HTH domain
MPHPVDVHVGKRVRQARWMKSMSQSDLAERVGIKFQQIQKYEVGANRISASRLWDIAEALEVDVAFFFAGMQRREASGNDISVTFLGDKQVLEMVRAYHRIPDEQRRRLYDLATVMAEIA